MPSCGLIFKPAYVRVYFNRSNCLKKEWSLDFGEGSPELLCGGITISAKCETVFNSEETNKECAPKAWLSFAKVTVDIRIAENHVYITHNSD